MKELFLCAVLFLVNSGQSADIGDVEFRETPSSSHATSIAIEANSHPEIQPPVENRKSVIREVWIGRLIRILGKPIMAIGSGLAYKVASTMGDPALGIPGVTAVALGVLMDKIGLWMEDKGLNRFVCSCEDPDSFLEKYNCFKRCNEITAAVYDILGKQCSFFGLPLVVVGGVMYISGDATLTTAGIVIGATGMAFHTLGGELEKLAKETKEEERAMKP